MPSPTSEQPIRWPAKYRRPTAAENADIRRKVHEVANRMREERIKGRPTQWTNLRY